MNTPDAIPTVDRINAGDDGCTYTVREIYLMATGRGTDV